MKVYLIRKKIIIRKKIEIIRLGNEVVIFGIVFNIFKDDHKFLKSSKENFQKITYISIP